MWLWCLSKAFAAGHPPPSAHTETHRTMNYQMPKMCTLSLHWLASCTCKSHGGRARYVSGSASFHILSDLLILTCSAGKDQISICLHAALWCVCGSFFNFVQCMGNRLGRYQLRKLQWYHICLWQTHWAVFGVPMPFNINQPTPYSFLLSFREKTTLLPQQVAGYWALLNSSQMSHQELHS